MLDAIREPRDLRLYDATDLKQIADELRAETISAVAATGGHLGAGLGVVELTVALHAVFDTPADRLIWDVGHQAYPHKILTGRRDRIRTLRQAGGLSGFTKRAESEYDPFGAAHSSTSISAGLAQGADAVAPAGQNLVRIGLVADVPDQPIGRGVEHGMQGHGQLDHAQAGAEMAAGIGHGVDGLAPQLVGQLRQLLGRQVLHVAR